MLFSLQQRKRQSSALGVAAVIFAGIDDTDIIGTPGTNQLARHILKNIGPLAQDAIISRHQLFFMARSQSALGRQQDAATLYFQPLS
jgi:hypothetical protein